MPCAAVTSEGTGGSQGVERCSFDNGLSRREDSSSPKIFFFLSSETPDSLKTGFFSLKGSLRIFLNQCMVEIFRSVLV